MFKSNLTLDNFKFDYNKLTVLYEDKDIRKREAIKLADDFYHHIKADIILWLETK